MPELDQDKVTTPSQTTKSSSDSYWGQAVGVVFLLVVVMSFWQTGFSGGVTVYFKLSILFAVGVWILLAAPMVVRVLVRYGLPALAFTFLVFWFWLGGSYSQWRDLSVSILVVLIVLIVFPESRLWLLELPKRWTEYRECQRLVDAHNKSPEVIEQRRVQREQLKARFQGWAKRTWEHARAPNPANTSKPSKTPERAPVVRRLSPAVMATCALSVWLVLSVLDHFFAATLLPRNGQVLRPPAMPNDYVDLRVGVALSGGGYRAALVHAGVVDALSQLGVPVTHLSSVSGGSIIGSFLSVGGSPRDFLAAVASGQFRVKRDLLAFQNAIRLPSQFRIPWLDVNVWPFFDEFSRLSVQAALLDRVLLGGATATLDSPRVGPALMVCMTDMSNGISVGALNEGYLFVGPTTKRFFRTTEAIDVPNFTRLAERVAVSGSFPGAFPAMPLSAHITTVNEPLSTSQRTRNLQLVLADGGIRDNLGLKLLETADELARAPVANSHGKSWNGFTPPRDWALDLILVSDGGKFFRSESVPGALAATMRAIDLSGLETGVLRAMRNSSERPLVVLSALSTVAPSPDALIYGMTQTAQRDNQYQYFRPKMFDDATLSKIVSLVPNQVAAQAALMAYKDLPSEQSISLNQIGERCASGTDPSISNADCVWWRLVSIVGNDIWQATEAFISTPTLSDTFNPGQAEAVFRFGQYMTFLKASEIRAALKSATEIRLRTVQQSATQKVRAD